MLKSKLEAPHFYVQTEVPVDDVRARLDALNASEPPARVTLTVALVRACVAALAEHPRVNSVWTDDGLLQAHEVNLGIAVALDDGLLAPALLSVDRLGVFDTAVALGDLVQRAHAEQLRPRELTDATFTLSNLGRYDVTAFTAIVTPPQVAILATGRVIERVVLRDDVPAHSSFMTVTLSADHRALNGVDVARFLETFKSALLDPDVLAPAPTN